jgi:hypothetical protein
MFTLPTAGVYLVSGCRALGRQQRKALCQLLKALGSLQRKKWTAAELAELDGEVILAICMVEAYLPLCEMDLKVHAILHLPGKIRRTGPLWVTAMWVYEGMWNHLLRFSRNQAHPELSLLRQYSDYEDAMRAFWLDPDKFAVKAISTFTEETVQEVALRYQIPREAYDSRTATVGMDVYKSHSKASADTRLALHMYYIHYDSR